MPSSEVDPRRLEAELGRFAGVLRENAALGPLTHLRIGGPARVLVEPRTEHDAARLVRACLELDFPLLTLGGGSNIVVADAGVDAVVLSLVALNRSVRDGDRITAGAGVSLPALLRQTKDAGLSGLEVLIGVPAMVGGAVAMNAGTKDGETFDHLTSLTVVDATGELHVLPRRDLHPRYRDGGLPGSVVLHATFDLHQDDPAAIFARMDASLRRRNATQPVTERSVGCVFRNPVQGPPAAKLIDDAGCKLMEIGDVVVSAKHANYFVNRGAGTSRDFVALMRQVQERVRAHSGIELQPEVKLWGPVAGDTPERA